MNKILSQLRTFSVIAALLVAIGAAEYTAAELRSCADGGNSATATSNPVAGEAMDTAGILVAANGGAAGASEASRNA